jgi:putative ABC transport system permease protein
MRAIRNSASGLTRRLKLFVGKDLEDDTSYGVGLSSGLAEQLELSMGSTAIAMAPTVDGQINALDIEVFQLFETTLDVLNDKLMQVPLKFAQALYDTNSVDRITVLLKDTEQTESMRAALKEALARRGLEVEVKTWRELSVLYNKVKDMFDIIFLFLFIVVLIIAAMSVINTISMTVVERTREIGTLRALGVKRRGIIKLFALESIMLGILGSLAGTGLTWMSWLVVKTLEPQWVPPLVSQRLPLAIDLVPEYMVWSALFLVALSVGAASVPARQAAHQDIVEALGHV